MVNDQQSQLTSLGELKEVIGKLWKAVDSQKIASQADTVKVSEKIDLWIKTNQTLLESNQQLLNIIAANSQEVQRSASSYEQGMQLLLQLKQQLQSFEASTCELKDTLMFSPTVTAGTSLPKAQEILKQLQQTGEGVTQHLQEWETSCSTLSKKLGIFLEQCKIEQVDQKRQKEQITWKDSTLTPKTMLSGALLAAVLMATGGVIALTLPKLFPAPPLAGQPRKLTQQEVDLLKWAQSQEGKIAHNLTQWNAHKLTRLDCLNDVRRLGVTLAVDGRPSTYGFCTLWVVAPEKRQFKAE